MEYFSSISSGDDEVEPSFKEFLKRWDFKHKYPSLWNDFSRIFAEKAFDASRSKTKVEVEKQKKDEMKKPKDSKPKIMRFPSDPNNPSPIISNIQLVVIIIVYICILKKLIQRLFL